MHKLLSRLSPAVSLVLLAVMASSIRAQEPVAQARTLLEQKKYQEAEKVLEKELAKKNPAAEALQVGMEVAVADGRIVTASQRAKTLLRVTENKDLGLVYRAGQVALMAGQDNLALSRFRTFADKSGEKSDRIKYALDYVLERGVYLNGYKRYLNLFGADDISWHRGTRLLEELFADDEPKKALEVARILFGHYAANAARADHLAARLADTIQGVYNRNGRLAYEALDIISTQRVNNQGKVNHIFDMAWPFINAKQRVDMMIRIQKKHNILLYDYMLNKFQEMINLPKDDDKLKAGRMYLSFEPMYRDAAQGVRYKDYLWVILERPQVFHITGNELVNDTQIQEKFAVFAGKFKDHPNPPDFFNNHVHRLIYHYLPDKRDAQVSFLKTHVALLHRDRFRELVAWTEGKELDAQLAGWGRGKGALAAGDMRFHVLDWYNNLKRKDDLLAASRAYMMTYPGHWDGNHIIAHFINSALLTPEEKITVLKEVAGKAGLSAPLVWLVKELTKRDESWRENAAFQAFKTEAEGLKAGGSDLVMTTAAKLRKIKVNHGNPSKEILPIVQAFLDKYKGVIPGDRAQAHNIEQGVVLDIFDIHIWHMWNKAGQIFKVLELWAPRFATTGAAWDKMIRRAHEHGAGQHGRGGTMWEAGQHYAALLDKSQKGSNEVFYRLAHAYINPKDSKSLFSNHYAKMGRHAITYVGNQVDPHGRPEHDGWAPAHYLGEVEKLLKAPGIDFNKNDLKEIIRRVYQRSNPKNIPSDGLIQTLSDKFRVEEARSGSYDLETETWLCGLYTRCGRGDAARKYFDSHFKALGTRKPHERMNALIQLANWGHLPTHADREYVVLNLLKPAAEKLPAASWPRVGISYRVFERLNETERDAAQAKKTQVQQLRSLLAEKALTSAAIAREKRNITGYLTATVLKMSGEKHWEATLGAMNVYVTCVVHQGNWDHSYRYHVKPVVEGLEKMKASEPLYVFADMLSTRVTGGREAAVKQLAAIKARVVRDIPGLVPVDKGDPTHDLHLAAREFMLGNEPRAWELTRPKLNILQQKWVSMDISYVAWVIEQMRKQKLHKEALEFCFTVLMKEFDYDAENMARISLAKGDIYRDRENYQAARIEYQGLHDNKRYRKTEAGKLAKYRLISLMILTKDYTAAEQKLERLVDAGTLREQAEAYYLFAKMSFEQQEHKQSHDYLKEVFKRIHGHVHGRLLEGELRLLLPRGLASTEVAIGRLDLQTVAIPGRELTLKLQDNNLSIARGGKAIPVVVTTTKGGDQEEMELMVSSDDETLFIGRISTALGEPEKNNLLLEIGGLDQVCYQIDQEFQKANDLDYPPKILEVKANARLVASAGEILSREEQEKREMERRLAMTQQEVSARFRGRNNTTVRPGSPIYVQVTDPDRDITSEADTVPVTLVTSSGDALEDFTVTETGAHTGVFEVKVPTGIPFPMATASDSQEGQDPSTVINSTRPETWTSLPDGKKPKWIEVDTMTSHSLREVSIETPDAAAIRKVRLLGSLAGDLGLVAVFPEVTGQTKGGLTVEMKYGSNHLPHDIRRQLRRRIAETYWVDKPDYNRHDTRIGKSNGWYITRMKGTFWLKENRMLELKLLQEKTVHGWQWAHVFVDGETFISGCIQANELKRTRKMFLAAGGHNLEVLVRDHWENSRVIVGYRQEDGTFATLPAEWFSTDENPDLAKLLQPKGKIERTESGFTAKLETPQRFRRLRWVFEDFNGNSVSAKSIAIIDVARKRIIPSAKDFSTGKTNKILEVAAGDRIEVTYNDDRRLDKDKPVLNAALNSSFANGKISLCYEELITDANGNERAIYSPAKRVRKGDQLMVIVEEYDEDLTENRDKIDIQMTSSSGEKLDLQTLETAAYLGGRGESAHDHAGTFFQILKFGDITQKNTIKIKDGDRITAGYLDRENADPGVAIRREYQVLSPGPITPEMTVYLTRIKMVEDKSVQAQRRIKQLRLQGDDREEIKVFKAQVVAELPPDLDDEEEIISASVQAPLLLEVFYPGMALHMRSRCEVIAVAESELKAAKAENREPKVLKVPLLIDDISQIARRKGYDVRVQNHVLQRAEAMLAEGRFAGVVRLQMGAPGDPVDDLIKTDAAEFGRSSARDEGRQDERFRVPTMIVAGSDIVHLSIKDESGTEVAKRKVRLLSDGRMALMDRTYTVPCDAIHLGQKFHVQVADPDQDVSPDRDAVSINVAVNGGDEMKVQLQETLPHSGIFSAAIKPEFVEKDEQGNTKRPDKTDNVLRVNFGNELVFEYIDDKPLTSDTSIRVATKGLVHKGANGRLAGFTKRFKDPEMAVKTRFLMAEALFEMAKDHRKLKKIELADEEIAEGKRILEEAMRDYPDTSLVAQGEFLLANLAQEMKKYQEAIGRYSSVISNWPDSEYAARSQFKKAICLEKMEHYEQSCEEYVRLTYLYPENSLVADATVRLGNYYYKRASYRTAGRIFEGFQKRHPEHELAVKALFLAGQSYMKMESERGEGILRDYGEGIKVFARLIEEYPDEKVVRSEAMYWLGESYYRNRDYVKAYRSFKKLTWDYPETKWAKIARGRLTEETLVQVEENEASN